MEPGLNKGRFKVCKFALKRIEGQAPLTRTERPTSDSEEDDVEEEDEDEEAVDEESTAEAEPGQTQTDAEDDVPASEVATDTEPVADESADTAVSEPAEAPAVAVAA